jgi:ElaA protein
MNWRLKSFSELLVDELYDLLSLRSLVFVLEQNCIFHDMDGKDQQSMHLMGYDGDTLVAYTRLVPAGVSYAEMSIGRVVTHPDHRRTGAGKALMQQSIVCIRELWGDHPIRIGAQQYLKAFYESFGFVQQGDVYIEDGIPHMEMVLQ